MVHPTIRAAAPTALLLACMLAGGLAAACGSSKLTRDQYQQLLTTHGMTGSILIPSADANPTRPMPPASSRP